MKKLIYLPIVLALLFTACKTENKQKETKNEVVEANVKTVTTLNGTTHFADVNTSQVVWKGFKPTGSHDGILLLKNGEIEFNEGNLKQAYFEIDMNSIECKDMPADDENNQKLVGHLKSADFFNVEEFPSASFKLTSQKTDEKGQLLLTGDLTVKEITKSISFPASLNEDGQVITLVSAPFNINRTDYGIKYKSKNFFKDLKDKFINDEFEVSFDVALKAK